MENNGENPQPKILTPEERLKVFTKLNEMLKSTEISGPIGMDERGGMDSTKTAEIISSLEGLDLSNAKSGDVVWWKTANSSNLFLVEDENKTPTGSFKSFPNDNSEGRTYENAILLGAGIRGGMLVEGNLKKGLPAEMTIPSRNNGEPPTRYWSSATHDIGIISQKAQDITPTP